MMTPADYYLLGLLSFIALLLIAILGILYRQSRAIGRLEGHFDGLNERIDGLNERIDGLNERIDGLSGRIDGVETSLNGRIDGLSGRIDGMETSLSGRIDGLSGRIDRVETILTARIERLEEQMANLREQVAEIRGLLISLHERVDLLMRHRHDDAGRVVITPEEVAAD